MSDTGQLGAELDGLEREALEAVAQAADGAQLEQARVAYLGKKGSLTRVLRAMGGVSAEERPVLGQRVNEIKTALADAIELRGTGLKGEARAARLAGPQFDVTLPGYGQPSGHVHPISRTLAEITEIFVSYGFSVAEGPEIEDDYHNFEALNIPADHPARDMQDTFFIDGSDTGRDDLVLRTHTSPVQIRVMETTEPPLRIIAPGCVYRHDDDVTHSPMFHQVEGFMVDRGITFGHLKGMLTAFLRRIFDRELPVRFRPSFFPFTEPSAEADIGCVLCDSTGLQKGATCRICKGTGWLEILGAGMVDPAVFAHVGYDPEEYTGFAFGLGVERIAMLKYGIGDIRLFYGGDLRFLSQF